MKIYKKITTQGYGVLFTISLFILLFLQGCKDENNSVTPPLEDANLFEALQDDADFSDLVDLIEDASLQNTLTGNMIFTFFAPSNAAFAKLPEGFIESLTQAQKVEFLKYHLSEDENRIENDVYNETLESFLGDPLFITVETTGAIVNNTAAVTSKNVDATNGVIHKIDEILIPDAYGTIAQNLKKRYEWAGLYDQLEELNLLTMLAEETPLSFMVPPMILAEDIEQWIEMELTEDQFIKLWKYSMVPQDLSGIGPQTQMALETMMGDSLYLTMHAAGEYVFNGMHLTQLDEKIVESSNGTIYFMESIMVPDELQDILTMTYKRYYLTTVRSALATAKMTGRLYNSDNNADEQFTIFMPRNNSGGINELPLDEDELANILKYHVLLEKISASELQHNQTYTTWQGEELTITRNGDEIIINGTASIKLADIEGQNGMVHVIDHLLTPPAE